MKYTEAPIYNYPTKESTDPEVLYRSLGSFWTQIFNDIAVLKGYTLGLAEELIQRYLGLLEVVNSYSVKDIDVFHREKWAPIIVYKSKFNTAPFVFKSDDAVFGAQPNNDKYYQNIVFQFGFPKKPTSDVYVYSVGSSFKDFEIIADRVFDPQAFYVKGTDVILDDGVLIFNKNIFDDPNFPKLDVILENGEPKKYLDQSGVEQQEQIGILWTYQAQIDEQKLYYNFGYIFNLNLNNDEFFRQVLEQVINLHIGGPCVNNIINICNAFLDIRTVINETETVISVFENNFYKVVVTDLSVYKFNKLYEIKPDVKPGAVFARGFSFVAAVEYYDNVETPNWWNGPLGSPLNDKLAISPHVFLGNYDNQLVFKTTIDLITLNSDNQVVFPLEGKLDDVVLFNKLLNEDVVNVQKLKKEFNLNNPGDSGLINPVKFLMENFLKSNTSFIKFNFIDAAQQSKFVNLMPILRNQLPPYVYFIFGLNFRLNNEEYFNLNNKPVRIKFENAVKFVNADGSNDLGEIEKLTPYNYTNVKDRLFEIGLAVKDLKRNIVIQVGSPPPEELTDQGAVTMCAGKPLKEPTQNQTTETFSKLQLLDFT